jgi:hypothetical protein
MSDNWLPQHGPSAASSPFSKEEMKKEWTPCLTYWARAPDDAKILAFAITIPIRGCLTQKEKMYQCFISQVTPPRKVQKVQPLFVLLSKWETRVFRPSMLLNNLKIKEENLLDMK